MGYCHNIRPKYDLWWTTEAHDLRNLGFRIKARRGKRVMKDIRAETSAVIDASPEQVYRILRDYEVAHPAILPTEYFKDFAVESGGQGEGTVFRLRMQVYGRDFPYYMKVSEPVPGRELLETDLNTGNHSRFVIEPLEGGRKSKVTIIAHTRPSKGIAGQLERLMSPRIMRKIFDTELGILNQYVKTPHSA
jgi:hypothetical protein